MEEQTYYRASPLFPHHLSVGAVLFDEDGRIAVHEFPESPDRPRYVTLMRETLNWQESLEEGLVRGLAEEFGAKGHIVGFLGSLASTYRSGGEHSSFVIHKTTVYFLVRKVFMSARDRDPGDPEAHSSILWYRASELLPRMRAQGRSISVDIDESRIVQRADTALDSLLGELVGQTPTWPPKWKCGQ